MEKKTGKMVSSNIVGYEIQDRHGKSGVEVLLNQDPLSAVCRCEIHGFVAFSLQI